MLTFVALDQGLVHRAPAAWVTALGVLGLVLSIASIVGSGLGLGPAGIAGGFYGILISAALLLLQRSRNLAAKEVPVKVAADASGLTLGAQKIARSNIKDGFVIPKGYAHILRLGRRGIAAPVEIIAPNEAQARGLLRALGLDASQTVGTFRLPARTLAHRWKMVFGGIASALLIPLLHHIAPLIPILSIVVLLSLFVTPSYLDVGVDGLLLRWLWTKRFISFNEILDVSRYEEQLGRTTVTGLRVTLKSNEQVTVPIASGRADDDRVLMIQERIRESREVHDTGGAEVDASVLHRGDKKTSDWIEHLRRLGSGANADARTAPVNEDTLFRIALDPSKRAPERAAAAVALGAQGSESTRARIREVAATIAAPKLRIAIESAAEADKEAELEAALDELEQEERQGAETLT
jgi:hypothetical protein